MLVFITFMFMAVLMTGCGTTYVVAPSRTGFASTYADRSPYRPSHYRNFQNGRDRVIARHNLQGDTQQRQQVRDDMYKANTYVDTYAETEKPVYHTTYTTSFNDAGEVTTTYTTDYVGSTKEKQYYKDVRREQKKQYRQSRKRKYKK